MPELPPLETAPPISARFVEGVNGLRMHLLQAGEGNPPRLLLLHGFPELAFSWRHVMPALAAAGFHVLAPDLRGFGRTTGWSADYDADIAPFCMPQLARDVMGLLWRLGLPHVDAVIGHDFGAPLAAWCALLRPDVFQAAVLMSAPFAGPPAPAELAEPAPDIHAALAALPRPRKHYQWHYSERVANAEMWHPKQGLSAFLRAYFHMKSSDWRGPDGVALNRPHRLAGWTAEAIAVLPTYYIMDRAQGMAETVAPHLPPPDQEAACSWLSPADLAVYAEEYGRTGFQGGLNWYRCQTSKQFAPGMSLFHGRVIDVPALFLAGEADWGLFQFPGAVEAMQGSAFARMQPVEIVPGAGHWVQQEQPAAVVRAVAAFMDGIAKG